MLLHLAESGWVWLGRLVFAESQLGLVCSGWVARIRWDSLGFAGIRWDSLGLAGIRWDSQDLQLICTLQIVANHMQITTRNLQIKGPKKEH